MRFHLVNGDQFEADAVTRQGQEEGVPRHITFHFTREPVGLVRIAREEDLTLASHAEALALSLPGTA